MSEHLEIEVKFLLDSLPAFRQQLLAMGARQKKRRVFEKNVRLDTADEALLKRWQLLRVRQDTAVTITFKSPPQDTTQSEARVREELEIKADNFDTAVTLFRRLGFEPKQVYEKYRETFQWDGVEIVLDEMPFGNFVELEGEEAVIKTAAARLNLDWQKRILTNYLGLMAQLKAHHHLPFDDLTFANFENLSISIADVLS